MNYHSMNIQVEAMQPSTCQGSIFIDTGIMQNILSKDKSKSTEPEHCDATWKQLGLLFIGFSGVAIVLNFEYPEHASSKSVIDNQWIAISAIWTLRTPIPWDGGRSLVFQLILQHDCFGARAPKCLYRYTLRMLLRLST
jgi:hypothetical protein